MWSRAGLLTCCVITTLFAVACTNSDPIATPPAGHDDPLPSRSYPRINASDGLDQWLFFGDAAVAEPSNSSPMQVEVSVRSRANDRIAVQYKFEFFDRNRKLLTRSESWQYVMMEPRLEHRFTGTSTHPDTEDWRLVVRSAR